MAKKKRTRKNNQYILPEPINPPIEELEAERERILEFYTNLPKFTGDPIAKTNEVLESCKVGWRNAPHSFKTRVDFKIKNVGRMQNWGANRKKEKAEEVQRENIINEAIDIQEKQNEPEKKKTKLDEYIDTQLGRAAIVSSLSEKDRKFFEQRERYYRSEFEFNNSSDFSLLIEVIADELKIQKIHEMEFEELKQDIPSHGKLMGLSKMVTEAHQRLERSLRGLGVTRDQRKDELDKAEGDITQLVIQYEKKKQAIDLLEKEQKQEEDEGLRRKYLRGDVYPTEGLERALHNRIPEGLEARKIIEEAGIQSFLPEDKKEEE